MRVAELNIESSRKEIAVANLKMLLPGDKGKTVAHFQQITGNVFYQLFLYVLSSAFLSLLPNRRYTGLSTGNWQGRFVVLEVWL